MLPLPATLPASRYEIVTVHLAVMEPIRRNLAAAWRRPADDLPGTVTATVTNIRTSFAP
jgi:hypothetical protein